MSQNANFSRQFHWIGSFSFISYWILSEIILICIWCISGERKVTTESVQGFSRFFSNGANFLVNVIRGFGDATMWRWEWHWSFKRNGAFQYMMLLGQWRKHGFPAIYWGPSCFSSLIYLSDATLSNIRMWTLCAVVLWYYWKI